MRTAAQLAIPVVAPRAIVLWVLIRLVFAMLPLAKGSPFGSTPPAAAGIVILTGIVGLIDVHVRGEPVLWANLGVTALGLWAIYTAIAIPAEFTLALVVR